MAAINTQYKVWETPKNNLQFTLDSIANEGFKIIRIDYNQDSFNGNFYTIIGERNLY